MKKSILIVLMFCSLLSMAQSPKREFRSTWLTTVWNIDWPKTRIGNTGNATQIQAQKRELTRILDSLVSVNMNAACFQIRSRSDAMYPSSYEPWSSDLVASRGLNPGYDPLAFAIEECHKRGIELHAWINPFRYCTSNSGWGGANDYENTHPDWIVKYPDNNMQIIDPANPEVRFQIKSIIGEVINNYDVDGIIFDDYFYAYGGTTNQDSASVRKWKPDTMPVGDWRRSNINKAIAAVYDTIQEIKPWVNFGVSPFGIWTTNKSVADKEGIELPNVTGGNMYEEIYCDPVAWLKEGTVDYISPQLYWSTNGPQDFAILYPWWSKLANQFGKHMYASMSTSNFASNLTEITAQTNIVRNATANNAPGSIYYNTTSWYSNLPFTNLLRNTLNQNKALTPARDWKHAVAFGPVSNIVRSGNTLTWDATPGNVRYAVYAVPTADVNKSGNFNTSNNFIGLSYTNSFTIPTKYSASSYKMAVSIVDRYGNEFAQLYEGATPQVGTAPILTYPNHNASLIVPNVLRWDAVNGAEIYVIQIARDANFTDMVLSRETSSTSFSLNSIEQLLDGKTYYWKVIARAVNKHDAASTARSFTVTRFTVTTPASGTTDVSLTPTINWIATPDNSEVLLEIATTSKFTSDVIVYSQKVSGATLTVPEKTLVGLKTYFVRVTAQINGVTTTSPAVNFTTIESIPATPVILSPTTDQRITGRSVLVKWDESTASDYRIELSTDPIFPSRSTKIKTTSAYQFETEFTELAANTYYIRVRGNYSNTMNTAWSNVVKIFLTDDTALENPTIEGLKATIYEHMGASYLHLECDYSSALNLKIYNVSGQLLKSLQSTTIEGGQPINIQLPTHELNSGLYLIQIKTNEESIARKFMTR